MRGVGVRLLVLGLWIAAAATARLEACMALVQSTAGPLELSRMAVKVQVDNVVARFMVEQTFVNQHEVATEGTYVFPVPKGASVASFAMLVDGKRIKAQVTEKEAARREFQALVRQSRDPALLEFLGGEVFQASLGNLPAGTARTVELVYEATLSPSQGLFEVVLPLRAARTHQATVPEFDIQGKIQTEFPLQNVYSPSHEMIIDRFGDKRASFSYEGRAVSTETDVKLYFSASSEDLGVSLMTHRVRGEDGYFLLLLTPPSGDSGGAVARDVSLVVDTSGSMRGAKLVQAKKALGFTVDKLNADDRFELIEFSTGVRNLTKGMRKASDDNRKRARHVIDGLVAKGGTNIHGSMLEALKSRDGARPHVVIFMTDGEPTEGEKVPDRILEDVKKANAEASRIFVVGVGHDLNVKLMDGLSAQNRGSSVYVKPDQAIEEEMGRWYAKVSHPVLTDLKLDFGSAETSLVYPEVLPDMFAGQQLVIAGRYHGSGDTLVKLVGRTAGGVREYLHDVKFPADEPERDFLPRLWAQRRIGFLLDRIRLEGEKPVWKDEVVKLSKEFHIATPYTSFLVRGSENEPGPMANAATKTEASAMPMASRPKGPGSLLDVRSVRKPSPAPAPAEPRMPVPGSTGGSRGFGGGSKGIAFDSAPGAAPDSGADSAFGGDLADLGDAMMDEEADAFDAGGATESLAPARPAVQAKGVPARELGKRPQTASSSEAPRQRAPQAPAPPPAAAPMERRQEAAGRLDLGAVSGASAVEAAEKLKEMKDATTAGGISRDALVRYVAGKTFELKDGVWTDTEAYQKIERPVLRLEFNSDAYFELLGLKPDLSRFLSLGEQVVVVFEGVRIEILPGGKAQATRAELEAVFKNAR